MTQTLTPAPVPYTAMVTHNSATGFVLRYYPLVSVEDARAEFGPTLEDAQDFLAGVCCNECGVEKAATRADDGRYCNGCYAEGCDCVLSESAHVSDLFFCRDCNPCYFCPTCNA
jgi:hypothetical protein